MIWKRIKDRKKLHASLVDAGHSVPHYEEDEDGFNSTINTLMTNPMMYDAFDSHFDAPSVDTQSSFDSSPSVDTGPSFDGGGGMSGGGGADGSF